MTGTVSGGKLARETNYKRQGRDFYRRIGRIGGAASHTGGFHGRSGAAREAGAKGGRISRRGYTILHRYEDCAEYRNNETGEIVTFKYTDKTKCGKVIKPKKDEADK